MFQGLDFDNFLAVVLLLLCKDLFAEVPNLPFLKVNNVVLTAGQGLLKLSKLLNTCSHSLEKNHMNFVLVRKCTCRISFVSLYQFSIVFPV